MKEVFKVEEVEDFALLEPVTEEDLEEFLETGEKGLDIENLLMDMKGKISSNWNIAMLECLVKAAIDKSKDNKYKDLPTHSHKYFKEIILLQMERVRGAWRSTQPHILHNVQMETLKQVEDRMKEKKDASAKLN